MLTTTGSKFQLRLVALKPRGAAGEARRWGLVLALLIALGFWATIAAVRLVGARVF
jgi:hypothetical protein